MNRLFLTILGVLALYQCAFANPVLNFSDIDSGPNTGNSDGVGSGVIVTIWGNNLGSSQGSSKVYVGAVEATAVYYWKNADGTLPGGPADLSTYHEMQEIAFSVPSGAVSGANTISVTVDSVSSNTLPFTVRSGGIKFIKSTGSDSTGTGSWSNPWATLNNVFAGGNGKLSAGDTVYSVGVGSTAGIKIGGSAQVAGTEGNHISLVAYPNTTVAISGPADPNNGDGSVINNWWPAYMNNQRVNFSKLSVTAAGNCGGSGDMACNGISIIPYNRIVGVAITGPTVYGGYGGAITGGGTPKGTGVYLGIYIHDYGYQSTIPGLNNYSYTYTDNSDSWTSPPYNGIGDACTNCTSVDRFQHLYYISDRVDAEGVPYEIGWNYLVNNPILHGIHIYDMGGCGFDGTVMVHHNVVKNQRGGAIDIAVPISATNVDVWDNIIIYDTDTKLQGKAFRIVGTQSTRDWNNTIYGWHVASDFASTSGDNVRNNIFYDTVGVAYTSTTPSAKSDNLFYSTEGTPNPSWYSSGNGDINADPLFTSAATGDFSLQEGSPAIDAGYDTTSLVSTDFFNNTQASPVSLGAIEMPGPAIPSCALTGTAITGGVTETEIVSGGQTIILTLTNDTWDADVGSDSAETTALIAGITASPTQTHGYAAEVTIDHTNVVRTSDTVVTITLPASAGYNITQNEEWEIVIPTTCVASAQEITASPVVTVSKYLGTTYYFTEDGTGNGLSAESPATRETYVNGEGNFAALVPGDIVYAMGAMTGTITCNTTGGHTLRGNYTGNPASFSGLTSAIYCTTSNITIEYFTISGVTATAITAINGNNQIIQYCELNNNGTSDGGNYDGIFSGNGGNKIVRFNSVSNQKGLVGSGIDTSGGAGIQTTATINNNIVTDCEGNGFSVSGDQGLSDTITFFSNVVNNCAKGFYAYECGIFNYYNNSSGDVVQSGSGYAPFYFQGANCASDKRTITLRNNTTKCTTCNQAIRTDTSWVTLDSDYNVFLRTNIGNAQWGNVNGTLKSFTQWKASTGGDSNSRDADPLFVNPEEDDFNLSSTSPCIDTGTNVGLTTDYNNNRIPQATGYDIGAYEWIPTTFSGISTSP